MKKTKNSSKVAKGLTGDGPVFPTLHPYFVKVKAERSDRVGDGPPFPLVRPIIEPGPIILPLKKVHHMIKAGSIKLTAIPQDKLAERKLKGLTQKLSKYGFSIDIKNKRGK